MKKPFRTLLICALFQGLAFAPSVLNSADLEDWTLDEVLEKIEEANGGEDAIHSVTNARFLGEVEGQDTAYDFVLLKKRPNKMRIHLLLKNKSVENGFDGSVGWRRYTQRGHDRVVALEGDELLAQRIEADFDGPLVGVPTEGVVRRLVGIERIARIDYFIIEVQTPLGRSSHYIDSRTFRELKSIRHHTPEDGEPYDTVSHFHEIQRHEQIWVAHRVERVLKDGKKETVFIKEVELNPGILDMAFKLPKERNPFPGN